ncbi:MAG: RNA polymerase sigma factor [candidate division FCPU426 bacterium]
MKNLEPLNDEKLLLMLRRGSKDAGEVIFKRYYPAVLGLSRKYLCCQHDAEDIAQEVFLRALAMDKIRKFRGESSLRTWLFRIAINLCYSKHRKHREKLLLNDEKHPEPVIPSGGPDPEEEAMRLEAKHQLRVALWKLPKKYQTVIALFYQDQRTYSDIAKTLRQSVGSIGVCLKRGRAILNRRLAYRGVWV